MRDQSIDVPCHSLDQLQQSAGRIATISTDHAPWPLEAKHQPMLHPASGMPGLETFLQVMFTEAQDRGFPCPKWSSTSPAARPSCLGLAAARAGCCLVWRLTWPTFLRGKAVYDAGALVAERGARHSLESA